MFNSLCNPCLPAAADTAIVVILTLVLMSGILFLVFRRRVHRARSKSMSIVRIIMNFAQLVRECWPCFVLLLFSWATAVAEPSVTFLTERGTGCIQAAW